MNSSIATDSPPAGVAKRAGAAEIDDRDLARILVAAALLEIRSTAGRALDRAVGSRQPDDALKHVRFLANLCDNMPISRPGLWKPSRRKAPSRREQAMLDRPMMYTWNTAGPEGQAWILQQIERWGLRWTPPPPLPLPRKVVPTLTARQRITLLAGWPVKTPPGYKPLPRQSRVVKAVDLDSLRALYDEARSERLGLGDGSPWLYAHLAPGSTHYLFPDPPTYYWPDARRRWWQCHILLQMADGEQVSNIMAVLPETFMALPSTIPRRRQRRLVHITRALERDTYLWGRDHGQDCAQTGCEYMAGPTATET
jgi:hypothetical protein